MSAVRGHFRPEFINRIDDFIIFEPLQLSQIRTIVQLQVRIMDRACACLCVYGWAVCVPHYFEGRLCCAAEIWVRAFLHLAPVMRWHSLSL